MGWLLVVILTRMFSTNRPSELSCPLVIVPTSCPITESHPAAPEAPSLRSLVPQQGHVGVIVEGAGNLPFQGEVKVKEVDWVSCIVRGSSLTPAFKGKGDTGVCRMRGISMCCGMHTESPAHTWGGHF